jgi:hypothetical protein
VEHRGKGEEEWGEGYVTSLEPLKATYSLTDPEPPRDTA